MLPAMMSRRPAYGISSSIASYAARASGTTDAAASSPSRSASARFQDAAFRSNPPSSFALRFWTRFADT